jgi:hypothetical protein
MHPYRYYTVVLCLLIALLLPTQVLAMSCVSLEMRYVLTCENNDCSEGFKVVEQPISWGFTICDRLPYVLDLNEGELQSAVTCAHNTNADILSGIVEISSPDLYLFQDCTEYARYISVSQLSQESNLSKWRNTFEKETRLDRIKLHVKVIASLATVVLIGICIPLLLLIRARDLRALAIRAAIAILTQGCLSGILFFIGVGFHGSFRLYHISAFVLFLGMCIDGAYTLWAMRPQHKAA